MRRHSINMPRFDVRQLLLATTLVGIGLGMTVFGTDGIGLARDFATVPVLSVIVGCLTVGFGATVLFRKPQVGLLFGMTIFFCIVAYYGLR